MILLSKVIKSSFANTIDTEKKTIALKKILQAQADSEAASYNEEKVVNETNELAEQELQKAIEEAEQMKKEAENEYKQFQDRMNDEMLTQQKQAEQMFKQAEESGYNEGFQQGLEEGKRQYESIIEEAKGIVTASQADYFKRLNEAEPTIIQLALKVAEKIFTETIEENDERWLTIVKAVINEVREQEDVKLYIHPTWYELVLTHKEELQLLVPNCEHLYIYPDAYLDEHGCTVETAYGKIDASVDSQLTEIKRTLLEKLKELDGYERS